MGQGLGPCRGRLAITSALLSLKSLYRSIASCQSRAYPPSYLAGQRRRDL